MTWHDMLFGQFSMINSAFVVVYTVDQNPERADSLRWYKMNEFHDGDIHQKEHLKPIFLFIDNKHHKVMK